MTREYHFVKPWPPNTGIGWWDAARTELNKVIDAFNAWQLEGCPAAGAERVRALLAYGRQILTGDGYDGYQEELDRIAGWLDQDAPEGSTV